MDVLLRVLVRAFGPLARKKADAVDRHIGIDRVGLLVDEPPDRAGMPFTKSSDFMIGVKPTPS